MIAAKEKKEANFVQIELRKIELEEKKLKYQQSQANYRKTMDKYGRLYGICSNANATTEEKEKAYAKFSEMSKNSPNNNNF